MRRSGSSAAGSQSLPVQAAWQAGRFPWGLTHPVAAVCFVWEFIRCNSKAGTQETNQKDEHTQAARLGGAGRAVARQLETLGWGSRLGRNPHGF